MGLKNYIVDKIASAIFTRTGYPYYNGGAPAIYNEPYNGEKNAGELGTIKNYIPDFKSLSARSWQAYTESDLAQLIIHNFLLWTIGSGLKFKSEIPKDILDQLGIDVDLTKTIKITENNFNLFLGSKRSTTTRMKTFHQLAYEAKKHAIIGGDCLIILDYGRETDRNKTVSARIIDGYYIQSPLNNRNPDNGNFISNGVEVNKYGEVVAFWIMLDNMESKRIEAYTKTGTVQAYMVYGLDYRVDDYRGMPLLSAILETIKKLDRYKEATVGTAEELAKIVWFVEHANYSTGEDPIQKLKMAAGHGVDAGNEAITNTLIAQTARNIKYTTGKTTLNMPIGATLKAIESKGTLHFGEFIDKNFEILCATVGIPPEVALNKYTSSFSASMGAKGNWEFRVNFERDKDSTTIYQPFFNFWQEMEVYNGRLDLPGYVIAKTTDNFMVVEAYQKSRFVGNKIPFIDPLKEIKAVRAILGDEITPLGSYEQATEGLNQGNFDTVIEQASTEKKKAVELGFKPEQKVKQNGNTSI